MTPERLATFLAALFVFMAGLFAWRLQLVEKREFEVAEQLVTVFSKVSEALRVLRTRHDMNGFDGSKIVGARAVFRAQRKFYYGIPEDKMEAFEEVYKDLAPTVVLARHYLSDAIAKRMAVLQFAFESVKYAAFKLGEIDPEAPGDILFFVGDRPPLDRPEDPSEGYTEEEMIKIQDEELESRFLPFLSLGTDEDTLSQRIAEMGADLDRLCRPYKSVDPWRFFGRFWRMFVFAGDTEEQAKKDSEKS
jgi:hypothetical protein